MNAVVDPTVTKGSDGKIVIEESAGAVEVDVVVAVVETGVVGVVGEDEGGGVGEL